MGAGEVTDMKQTRTRALFATFFKIGAFTFGGGYAMVALLEHEFVEEKQWVTREEFLDMVAIAESTPGPMAVNSATYIGYKLEGVPGAAASTLAVCLPSFAVIYAISLFFDQFLQLSVVSSAFRGIQVCVVYLVLSAGLKMLKNLKKDAFSRAVLAAVLRSVLRYAGVQAVLDGVRPCVVAMILATAVTMGLSTLGGYTAGPAGGFAPDGRAIAVFVLLGLVHCGYKKIRQKAPSPIGMILLSAVLGIVFWH